MKKRYQKLAAVLMAFMLLMQLTPAFATSTVISNSYTLEGIFEGKKKDEMFQVTFLDDQGNTLDEMLVQKGVSVENEAPDAPQREGYVFTGWQSSASDLSNIEAKTVFTAMYEVLQPEETPEAAQPEEVQPEETPEAAQPEDVQPEGVQSEEEHPEEAQPVEEPATEGYVTINRIMPDSGIIFAGDTFTMEATVVGLDDVPYEIQWQYDAGEGWTDIEGDSLRLIVTANEDLSNVNYDWRLVLTIPVGDQAE